MAKKVWFDKTTIGNYFCIYARVKANSKEQALKRFIRYCKWSRDIKYLGNIVFVPKGNTYKHVINYGEHMYSFFEIKRPYETEYVIYITQIPLFLYEDSSHLCAYEDLKKCPYEITNPLDNNVLHFPTIEMAKNGLSKLEEEVKRSNLRDKKIKHNIPI